MPLRSCKLFIVVNFKISANHHLTLQIALMEISDWWVETIPVNLSKVVWKFVSMAHMVPCVMISGTIWMLLLYADSLGIVLQVSE